MSFHIIIDGYNLIYQLSEFVLIQNQEIKNLRKVLIDKLVVYNKIKKHNITVVFDGANAPLLLQNNEWADGIKIKFSQLGESADSVIKSMAYKEKQKAVVITSDRDIIEFASLHGAATITSAEFNKKLKYIDCQTENYEEDICEGWTPTTKKKGPKKRLSKKKRKNKIYFEKL